MQVLLWQNLLSGRGAEPLAPPLREHTQNLNARFCDLLVSARHQRHLD